MKRTIGYLAATGLALCLVATVARAATTAPLTLLPVWSDHAVIQRDLPVKVAGTAPAHAHVTAMLGDAAAQTDADAMGQFILTFPARAAATTPVDLVVMADGARVARHDLLVGDVWLCSGQSNMEYPLARALNGAMEVAQSADPLLRLLEVPKTIAYEPQRAFGRAAAWQASAPTSAADFSAACYFMARDLRKDLHVPIGAIHPSWGGSQLRPWLSPQAGLALYGAAQMQVLHHYATDPLQAVAGFAPQWAQWYRGAAGGTEPWLKPDSLTWQPVPQISGWLAWAGTPLATHATGTVWLRRQIVLTRAQAAAGAVLTLGVLDDLDMTFVNGRAVGNTFGWDTKRVYRLPPAYLHEGLNEVMVAVTNSYANGGFASTADKLSLRIATGEVLPLADGWRFSISPAQSYPPRPAWDANGGIGVMHNGMIAPLGPLPLKGVAWYQGESDADTPGYATRLTALIGGWRALFGPDLRVAVVQLANFGAVELAPGASNWANLRNDQRLVATQLPHVALVSAIDLGERSDIHPANKLTLGQRLALAARGVAMPMPVSAQREGAAIRVRFSGIEGGLHAWSGAEPLGVELCGGGDADCRYARATIDGDTLLLPGDGRPAVRVRYAWADSPVVNLYDARSLPVPGFALDVTGN
jgi:sialate O-acetylesterase